MKWNFFLNFVNIYTDLFEFNVDNYLLQHPVYLQDINICKLQVFLSIRCIKYHMAYETKNMLNIHVVLCFLESNILTVPPFRFNYSFSLYINRFIFIKLGW